MKRLIIISLVLAVMLLFVSWSFAGWNEGGFKNSPLFKHSLNEAVANMEHQGKQVAAEGENMETSSPKCYNPDEIYTLSQPTCDETCYPTVCGGECSTSYYTCAATWCDNTCGGNTCQSTCINTCESTCQSTCESTCQNTCSCPPVVQGTVSHKVPGGGYSSNWGPNSGDRYVFNPSNPNYYTTFQYWDGWYETEVFGQPACDLVASGVIRQQGYVSDTKYKQHQGPGSVLTINFKCNPY